jgi:hypothetical protein
MYKEAWETKDNKTQISVVQLLTVAVTVLITFVLPAQLITIAKTYSGQSVYTQTALEQRNQSSQTGQVAGISTASGQKLVKIPFTTYQIDLNSETGILIIAGLILLGLSIIIAIYLLLT